MSITIKTTTQEVDAASFLAGAVLRELKAGKRVLLFLAGGSSIAVGVKFSKFVTEGTDPELFKNLSITLTDERYGLVNHVDSNLYQLTKQGFNIPNAKITPILINDERDKTTEKFNENLKREFIFSQYKIGLFGIGVDGHTAGILPESRALNSDDLAFGYDTPVYSRITMTRKAIEQLDEAVVWMQGKEKWGTFENLQRELDPIKQPAQLLKKIPTLTIFSDYPSGDYYYMVIDK